MQYISGLAQRKALAVAALITLAGALLIAWAQIGATTEEIKTEDQSEFVAEPAATAEPTAEAGVVVYVSGAVHAPDVYRLPVSARVKDLVLAAGGLAASADPNKINLAEKLTDGQHVVVPDQKDTQENQVQSAEQGQNSDASAPINLNSANAAELDELPGIGTSIAERIVEYRSANGPFRAIEDLSNVKGIGPALLEKITPLVTIAP